MIRDVWTVVWKEWQEFRDQLLSLRRGGLSALILALILGVVAPLFCGWLLMKAWGSTSIEAWFVGTAMVATSVGITARVLSGMGLLDASWACFRRLRRVPCQREMLQ